VGEGDDPGRAQRLRELPSVHRLAVLAAQRAIAERRTALQQGEMPANDLQDRAAEILDDLEHPSLRRVLNATGVIVHTNLGRAPLSAAAREAISRAAAGYSNLELDLATGERGSRQAHVEALLCELTGAEAALAVNNGAAAVLLALAAVGGRVAISRGQLVEIGGGFRIPEVIESSGAELVEVGTTNRTRRADYERADADAILRVHRSNFATVGFVGDVEIEELCELGLPVIDDVGSGLLTAGVPGTDEEPSIARSVAAGAALVCCSGDKLLGGAQAGLLVGRSSWVAAAAGHPLARALRIDKLSLAALEATLALYRDPQRARHEIPVLAMLCANEATLLGRAQRLRDGIGEGAAIVRASSRPGGGALPLLELEGPAVALATDDPDALAAALRGADPPVLGRIHAGRVLLDPRTLADDEIDLVVAAVRSR
jgi:L-seryl-tRNA(Ser) seleniumtransferase